MLDHSQRAASLQRRRQGLGLRTIARTMKLSRRAVRNVVRAGSAEVPPLERAEKAQPHRDAIVDLHGSCEGNLVRVHEELIKKGAALSYQALTAFCRRHGIGHEPKVAAGHYSFEPGEEMQHDTSPHMASIGG